MKINSLKIFGILLLIIVLTAADSSCSPDPPPAPCQDASREPRPLESTEPFVHLYAPKVNVTAGEQFSLNLAALNPTGTAGNMDATLILTVPSGISIDGSDFGTSVQGFTHYTFTLAKGDSREIGIRMSAGAPPEDQLVENRKFRGEIFWEVENSNQSSSECYEVDLTVSHEPVELIFDLSDLPNDAGVRVASPGMCSQNNRCSLPYLKTQDLDINLSEEYKFLRYEYAGNKPEDVNSKSTTIRLTENTTITPFVEKVLIDTTLTLWAAPGGAGSVSAEGRNCLDGCIYPADIRLKINANPNSGWDFVRWEYSGSEPDSLTSAETDVTLTEDTTISAIFERSIVTLQVIVEDGGVLHRYTFGSTCRGICSDKFGYGSSVRIYADDDSGWDFDKWEVVSGNTPSGFDSDDEDHTITLNGDVTLRLWFVQEPLCSGIPVTECDALIDIYNATSGDNWTNNSGWLDGRDPSGWEGVGTLGGRVAEIYLGDNNLIGELPSSIGNLVNLEVLDLAVNDFRGELPPEIGNLTNLTWLYIWGNNFSGELPPEIGNLTNLIELSLSQNNFSGELPPEIGNLVNLTELYIWENNFSGELLPEIGNLTDLTLLDLAINDFRGELPPEIGNLTNLTDLRLNSNGFSGELPSEIGNLVSLETLWIHNNNFSGELPPSILAVPNLLYDVEDFGCSGILPVTECEALEDIYNATDGDNWRRNSGWMDDGNPNRWQGVQVTNGRVTGIYLEDNNLIGGLPSSIGNFTNLTDLYIWGNNFSGELPSEIGDLVNLEVLDLSVNDFRGELPSEIVNLTNLTELSLSQNNFSGELPPEIVNLTNLTVLDLAINNFSGELPKEISNLVNLAYLDLSENSFSGELPSEIGNLVNLEVLDLAINDFGGELLTEIGYLTNLTWLALSDNSFSGELPSEIEDLTNLTVLYIWGNNFSGELPSEIGDLTNLTELDLSENSFSGELPSSIGNLTNLTVLYIWGNNFSGELPSEIGDLTNLTELALSENSFSGELPSSIGNLTNLTVLYIWGNNFSGELPSEIGDLTNLTELALSENSFSGELPSEIGDLTNLTVLYIWGNNFSGRLPSGVCDRRSDFRDFSVDSQNDCP